MSTKQEISKQERIFCELFINGCAPYGGNAERCYVGAFKTDPNDNLNNHHAKMLLKEERIAKYIAELEALSAEEAKDMKRFLTANLKRIIEETSEGSYTDRRGVVQSPAALRGVAVSAAKALMEMYPIKEAQVNKLNINGGNEGGGGITFNVIVPNINPNNDK